MGGFLYKNSVVLLEQSDYVSALFYHELVSFIDVYMLIFIEKFKEYYV